MLTFRIKYFIPALLLFLVEVLIAIFVTDSFVRPYVGDFLVVIFMYCFLKSFLLAPVTTLALVVLLIAYTIEVLQYFNLVQILGLQESKVATTVIGVSFEWGDMLAYTLGVLLVLVLERKAAPQKN